MYDQKSYKIKILVSFDDSNHLSNLNESFNKWNFWKIWHLSFQKPYRLFSYDFQINIYLILKFVDNSKFIFVGQIFQKSKSADSSWKFDSWAWFWVLWCYNLIICNKGSARTCSSGSTQLFGVQPHFFGKPTNLWLQTEKSLN